MILNKESYDKYRCNLPNNFIEKVIEGGNHSSYTSYGQQKNDGQLKIEKNEQINVTINEIYNIVNKSDI